MVFALTNPKIGISSLGGLAFGSPLSLFKAKTDLALGLDIGSHAVKVCQLRQEGAGYQLEILGSAPMPENAVEDGFLVDPRSTGVVINKLLTNLGCKKRKVAISVSGYSVIVKTINLQVTSSDKLEKRIYEEAERSIPFDLADVYLDYHELRTNNDEQDYTDIILVAAKKELVDGYLEMLDTIGLQTVIVDVDTLARSNAFGLNPEPHKNVVLVNIGAAQMNINILAEGASVLSRDLVMGGRRLTKQLQQALELSWAEAEALKVGAIGAIEPDSEQEALINEITTDYSRQLSEEVKRAIDLYLTTHGDYPPNHIFTSGGGAKLAGLSDLFAQECALPCGIFNPLAKVGFDSDKIDPAYLEAIAPEMVQAFGLAIRTAKL